MSGDLALTVARGAPAVPGRRDLDLPSIFINDAHSRQGLVVKKRKTRKSKARKGSERRTTARRRTSERRGKSRWDPKDEDRRHGFGRRGEDKVWDRISSKFD